ncbi:MAG: fumarylacetoacetate hydrolase family protein, partial [Anaerolineae bacterium]|nr:fumarylacetoacetate hydrolase family protein [Anaerolineae bacterium]
GIVLGKMQGWPDATIHIRIERGGACVFEGRVHTGRIKRRAEELVAYLGRCLTFPDGVVLLTGTGVVPDGDFTLAPGDEVRITIDGLGELVNSVVVV